MRSREVKNRSLGVRDLSTSARRALQGAQGPVGAPGAVGPSGVTYRTAVNAAGVRIRGNAARASTRALGEFVVGFDRSVDDCVSTATLAAVAGGDPPTPPPGRITVGRGNGAAIVKTYDAAGGATYLPFHLIVAC